MPEPLLVENLIRPSARETAIPDGCPSFILGQQHKSYKQQYSNIYFTRLHELRKPVEERASARWEDLAGHPELKLRVLDAEKGQLCYIIGTIYLEMPLKPNILEDIARDHSLPAPPPPEKIYSAEDSTFLEDESGRIKLVGKPLAAATLVTGLIVSALGMENDLGEFEVLDLCYCGLAPQSALAHPDVDNMEVDGADPRGEWIALVSGLDVGSTKPENHKHDIRLQLLVEYLASEIGSTSEQYDSSQIARLIIAGNSFAPADPLRDDIENLNPPRGIKTKPRKVVTTATHPAEILAGHLLDIGRSMPIHIMPGITDPSSVTLPQQPLPRAMLGDVKQLKQFKCETNPSWFSFEECHMLGSSGQPLDDMCAYLPDPFESADPFAPLMSLRLRLLKTTLQCRHIAPTAPDTLACFPYRGADPFILKHTPHLYFHGNQPRFETELIEDDGVRCRIACIPRFAETGEFVLFNTRTLIVKLVKLDAVGMDKEDMPS